MQRNIVEKYFQILIKLNFINICTIIRGNWTIGPMSRVFANGLGDQGSIPGRVIPKTQKMLLDSALLNIQHYKVRIKGKEEQSRERSSVLPYTSNMSLSSEIRYRLEMRSHYTRKWIVSLESKNTKLKTEKWNRKLWYRRKKPRNQYQKIDCQTAQLY